MSTVGRDEKTVSEYIKAQEEEDRRLDQLNLLKLGPATFEVANKSTALSGSHLQASGFAGGMVTYREAHLLFIGLAKTPSIMRSQGVKAISLE